MAQAAWIWWLGGGVLALAGLWLLWWSLFRDRARGRRRCPRCWYDMAGVPGLVCPECGGDARREKRLGKTRRRWPIAVLGAIVVLGGLVASGTPTVRRYGPLGVIPTTVLILLAPTVPETHVTSGDPVLGAGEEALDLLLLELASRAEDPQRGLADWQWRILVVSKQIVHAWRDPDDAGVIHVRIVDPWFMTHTGQFGLTAAGGFNPLPPEHEWHAFSLTSGPDQGTLEWVGGGILAGMLTGTTPWNPPTARVRLIDAADTQVEVQFVYRSYVELQAGGLVLLDDPATIWSGMVEVPILNQDPYAD